MSNMQQVKEVDISMGKLKMAYQVKQEEIDNNILSMRFYYGHYGQPHETLQTQGL